jgi:hypothetical protein
MAINFPDSPSLNDTHTVGDKTWIYNGSSWDVVIANQAPNQIRDADNDTKIETENTADDDTLRFSTAGTERMTITSAGHLIPSANVTYDLGSASNRFRDLYLSGSSIDLGGVSITSDGTNLALPPISNISGDFTVDTSTLHVDSTNNRVGIGTTAPAKKLEISDSTEASILLDDTGGTVGGAINSRVIIYAGGVEAGSMGFPATGGGLMQIENRNGGLYLETDSAHDIDLRTNGSTRMSVKSNGRVGIGTTAPAGKLHVEFDSGSDGVVLTNTANTVGKQGMRLAFDNDRLTVQRASDAGAFEANYVAIDQDSGNVGIGTTTPNSALSVTGINSETRPLLDLQASLAPGESGAYQRGIRLLNSGMTAGQELLMAVGRSDNTRNQGQMYFQYSGDGSTSNRLSFGLYAVDDVLNIMGSGNVGIGTTSPAAQLHVNGEIVHNSQWAGCAAPSSWASAYINNWGQARGDGSFMTASSTGITINRSGRYHVIAGQRANSTTDTFIGIGENGNRTTLDSRTTGVWSHDHAGYPSKWTMSHYVGYLAAGEKLTAGAPNSTNASYLLFGSAGYAGFLTAIWLGD